MPGHVTSLMIAADAGSVTMCQLLMDHGALVDCQAANGDTALIYAAKTGTCVWGLFICVNESPFLLGSRATIDLLLSNGADTTIKGADNRHAASFVREQIIYNILRENDRLVTFLNTRGANLKYVFGEIYKSFLDKKFSDDQLMVALTNCKLFLFMWVGGARFEEQSNSDHFVQHTHRSTFLCSIS